VPADGRGQDASSWCGTIGVAAAPQLNIYEQINDRRPCFASSGTVPAQSGAAAEAFDFSASAAAISMPTAIHCANRETVSARCTGSAVVRSGGRQRGWSPNPGTIQGPNMIVRPAPMAKAPRFSLLFNPEPGWIS